MAETIVPVVHGERSGRYWETIGLHTLAATAAAGLLGLVLGLCGEVLGAPWGTLGPALVAGAAILYAAREALGVGVPIPDRRRQVPDWWRTFFSPRVAASLYGLGLGVGFLTYLTYGTFVAVAVAAFASGEPLLGALFCAPFGLSRALAVTVSSGAHSAEAAAAVVHRLEAVAARPLPHAVNAAVLAAVAFTALLTL
jgi:hypothetical protein